MLGDWSGKHILSQTTEYVILLDHTSRRARGLPPRPPDQCSSSSTRPALRDPSTTSHAVLGDCFDHSLTTARGLLSLATCEIWLTYSWEVIIFLDLATRLILRLPATSGTTSVRCTASVSQYRVFKDFGLYSFRPWHHMPTSLPTRLGD
jgi:hypothetical protein